MQRITIVTPAKPDIQNGNWSTTERWRDFLEQDFEVTVTQEWNGIPCDLMLALHARKSADSIRKFSNLNKPLAVVLTGTDLYRDIHGDANALASLDLANRLIALQSEAPKSLSQSHQAKCVVIEQSAPRLTPLPPRSDAFDLLLVGHMREVKDPLTALRSLRHLPNPNIRLRHIGLTNDPVVGPQARELQDLDSRIELLGVRSHKQTRELIRCGRILLLPSRLEGGANVLIEAVMSSIPVFASRIPGSVGLLGSNYEGYFAVGDDKELAQLVARAINEPLWLERLREQGQARAHLFQPTRERAKLLGLVHGLLAT